MQKQKVKKSSKLSQNSNQPRLLILVAFLTQTVIFFLSCVLAMLFDVRRPDYYIVSVVSLSLGSLLSGFISGKKRREKGLMYGTLFVLPSNIIYIVLSLALNGFNFDYNVLLSLLMLVACSAAGGVASVNIRAKKPKIPKRSKR